ncbi:MAG TPA: hypothetical protein VFS67_00540 [Polyangiaceae bacterium]|nr:hypothetical protein [Polyangiaceae bacterium]
MAGCGGASQATRNRVFYDWSMGEGSPAFERPYARLDWPPSSPEPSFLGVSVLEGAVRFSRPRNWRIRSASSRPGEPFIHYVSPNAYSFAIYQRRDPPGDSWKEILQRYESDVTASGAKILGQRVPMATYWGQGRAYSIERDVPATKAPFESHSREMVIRSKQRVVLVQIVYQQASLAGVDRELLRALETMEVR